MSEALAPPQAHADPTRRARRGVWVFLFMVGAVALVFAPLRLAFGGPEHPRTDFACMVMLVWTPALAATFVRGRLGEGFADQPLGLAPALAPCPLLVALLFPLGVMSVSYGVSWAFGLAPFAPPAELAREGLHPALVTAGHVLAGLPLWIFLALGEELGWRGYLVPRLLTSGWRHPLLLSGLVWSSWHVPAVLLGHYPAGPSLLLSTIGIVITLTAFAFVLARLRLDTGSVWPPTLAHAMWNAVLFDGFEPVTGQATHWTRESGFVVALVTATGAALVMRGFAAPRRAPDAS
jgi:membrane protease YdiL (CAAX protease family)